MRTSGRTSWRCRAVAGSLLLLAGAFTVLAERPADATALAPFIDLSEVGLTLDSDAAGLAGGFTGPGVGAGVDLDVTVGGTVRFALLYWGGIFDCGSADPCVIPSQPTGDQQVNFDGTDLTGTIIGTETQDSADAVHISFFADVTSIVSAAGSGPQTFNVQDDDAASELDAVYGAALIVAYTDATNPDRFRVIVQDNGDFAFGDDPNPGENRTTASPSFAFGAQPQERTAELLNLVGGGAAGDDVITAGPDTFEDDLDGSDGAGIDLETPTVTVPPGVPGLTVGVASPAGGGDPLFWMMSAVRVLAEETFAPTCNETIVAGPPTVATIVVEDDDSGLASITVTVSQNADTVVPPFIPGTTDPVVVTSTRIDQTQPVVVEMVVTDLDGNAQTCRLEFPNVAPTVTLSLDATPASLDAPGGPVSFDVLVTNTSTEEVVITALEDDILGDLSGEGDCTDAIGTVLAPSATYSCTYSDGVTGSPGDNEVRTATVTVEDLVINPEEATGSDTVTVALVQGTTSSTSSSSTSSTPTTAGPASTTTARVAAGDLSRTGSEPAPLAMIAGALFTLGGIATLLSARRPAVANRRFR